MITGRQLSASTLTKSYNCGAIIVRKPSAKIHAKEPKLIDIRLVKRGEDCLIAVCHIFHITSQDGIEMVSVRIGELAQVLSEHREPFDRPVIFRIRDCRLQHQFHYTPLLPELKIPEPLQTFVNHYNH